MMDAKVERLLEMACAIQQIPAPPFGECSRADFVSDQFQQAGLRDVHKDDIGNVYARLPGSGSAIPLVVSAHLDTVFPGSTNLRITKNGERIYGPGIGDNSLGVAALFGLTWALLGMSEHSQENSSLPGDIWLVANVGEEGLGDLRGMRAVVDKFTNRVKAYVILEGMALGQVYHRALGSKRYRISARTAGGHSWVNYGQPSAIHELAKLVTQLTNIPLPGDSTYHFECGRYLGRHQHQHHCSRSLAGT